MNKKLIELRRNLTAKLKEARDLIDAGKTGTFDSNEINKNILLVHNFITGETL